jgi:hypothetical protein
MAATFVSAAADSGSGFSSIIGCSVWFGGRNAIEIFGM